MNLFRGQLRTEEIFPFPYSLNEEQRDNLQALVDPTAKFFEVVIAMCCFSFFIKDFILCVVDE